MADTINDPSNTWGETRAAEGLADIKSKHLIRELMERGVIRSFGHSEYVPGIVRQRYEGGEDHLERMIHARQVDALAQTMVTNRLLSYDQRPPADPSAPPNDMVYEVSLLTLDPDADLEGKG